LDGRQLDNRHEGLLEINASMLGESTHHLVSLVSLKRDVRIEFVLEHPLLGDDMGAGGFVDKPPGSIGLESRELGLHGTTLVGIAQSLASG